MLGASNAWFPVQSSALSIPSQAERARRSAIDEAWSILDGLPAAAATSSSSRSRATLT